MIWRLGPKLNCMDLEFTMPFVFKDFTPECENLLLINERTKLYCNVSFVNKLCKHSHW